MYPRDAGSLPGDITAYHPEQQNWGLKRHQRPEILHQYEKDGYKNPTYVVPIWVHNGKIVLDHEDHPILAFRNMPATISTKVEGFLQEAISREDSRIDVKDFRARMMENPKGKTTKKSTRPSLSAISMRRSRFRWRAGYLSWTTRTGSQDIKDYLDALLPDTCKMNNTTKGFRDLKRSEVKLMSQKNRGKHLKRAGSRSITVEKRKQMDAAFYKSIEEAKVQEQYFEGDEEEMELQEDEEYEENYQSNGLEDDVYNNEGLEDDDHEDDGLELGYDDKQSEIDPLTNYDPDDPECIVDPIDYRFITPRTYADMHVINSSLEPTRKSFLEITEMLPPPHDFESSYAMQYAYLRKNLAAILRAYGQHPPFPMLSYAKRQGWETGFPQVSFIREADIDASSANQA